MVSMSLFQIKSMFSFGSATYWSYISNYLQLRLINILPSVCKAFFSNFSGSAIYLSEKYSTLRRSQFELVLVFFKNLQYSWSLTVTGKKANTTLWKITLHQLKNFNDWTHGNIHWKFWPRYIVSKLYCDGFPWFTSRSIRSFNILSLRKPPERLNLFTLVRLKYRPSGPQLCSNVPPKGRISKYVFFFYKAKIATVIFYWFTKL